MGNILRSRPPNALQDRLLRTTLVILRIMQYLSAAAAAIAAFIAAAFWLLPNMANNILKKSPEPDTVMSNTALFLTITIAATLTFLMFAQLVKVVQTVGEGNAFTTENAVRLRKIAYLSLGILASEFVVAWIGYFYHESTRDGIRWFDWDPSSIITILVLFVMARVFEEGVRLNDEAQLTV
jgi:ABC-type multidrug transport system fused ATPase/permease subunit